MKRDKHTLESWGLSIIKDSLRHDKLIISDNCPKLLWEMQNYHRTFNRGGDVKILKRDDHLIDCLRYLIADAGYSLPEYAEPEKQPDLARPKRAWTLEQDIKAERSWAEP